MSIETPSDMLAAMVLDTPVLRNKAEVVLGVIGSAERAGIRVVKGDQGSKVSV